MAREWADPYVYQGTGVLVNKLGIRDENALKKFEYEATDLRTAQLLKQELPPKFDFAHLKAVHAHLFKDVYDWAGQPRTVDISKGGATYERVQNIEAAAGRISSRLQEQNNLRGLDKRQFVEKFSSLYADLNALHPFREGNGRSTREFIGQLARGAGYELDQTRIDNDKNQWNKAAAQSVHGELGPIKEIFAKAIRPSRAVAFETLPRAEALQRHPELHRTFADMDALQKTLAQRHPGNQKAQEHFLSHARTEAVRKLDQGVAVEIAPPREGQPPAAPTVQRTEASNKLTASEVAQRAGPGAGQVSIANNAPRQESLRGKTSSIEPTSAHHQSLLTIDDIAKQQGVTQVYPLTPGSSYRGEVAGISAHHTLIKVADGVGVRAENDVLSRGMAVGERVKLDPENPMVHARAAQGAELGTKGEERDAGNQLKMSSGHEQAFQKQ